jgi:hypothetical protein
MTNANWGGPGAGHPGYPQNHQGYSQDQHVQDPAWHGQAQPHPQAARSEPPLRAQPAPQQARPVQPQQPRATAHPYAQAGQPHPRTQAQAHPQHQARAQAQARQAHPQQVTYAHHHPAAQPQAQPQQHYAQAEPHYAPPEHYAPQFHPQEPLPEAAGGGVAGIMNGLGAVVSIALIAGLAVWGYKLAMRDVTEIPVIAALEGPMRIQPENPGGEDAEHQGLAVNNVAAEGSAEGPANQLVLAPPADTLDEDDAPAVSEARIEATPTAEAGDSRPTLGTEPLDAAASPDDAQAAAQSLVEQIAAEAAPLSGEEADLSMTPEAEERALAAARSGQIVQPDVPGVARSPRPQPRPNDLVARAAASPSSDALLAAAQQAAREVDPADIPAGTRLVQLGAFDTEDVARAEWDLLTGRFAEYLDDKSRVIEKAQSGGKTFYRLRAMGFEDLSEARRLCAALTAGKASCIPVVTN